MKRRTFVGATALTAAAITIAPKSFATMTTSAKPQLLHYVLFWLKDGLTEQEIKEFAQFFEALKKIETVKSLHYGRAAATPVRPVTDNSFSYSMTAIFESIETHNTYQEDKRHHAAIEKFSRFWSNVVVHDTTLQA